MYRCFFFLLLLFSSINTNAQSDLDNLVQKGIENILDFQLSKAEDLFQSIIKKYPSSPQGYHYISNIYLLLYLSNKKQDDYNKFIKYSDLTLQKAETILDDNDEDKSANYILGSNYGFRAMAFIKQNDNFSSIWAVKNANKYLKNTLEIDPKFYDAYLVLGLFNYALSFVPGVIKWTLKLAGISGNRDEGIKFLNIAYRKGKYTRPEAAYYLSQVYSETIIDYDKSLNLLSGLVRKYPNNILFKYSYAVTLLKNNNVTESEKYLRQILKENNQQFGQTLSFANFTMGDIEFKKNDFGNAVKYFDKFLTTTNDIDYSGIAYLRMGISCELSGKREEAKKYYILARNGNLDLADDAYAKRKSEIYFEHALSNVDQDIIKSTNLIGAGDYKTAINLLETSIQKAYSERQKAEINFYISEANYYLENFDESLSSSEKAIKLNSKPENWVKPFSSYNSARALFKMGQKDRALNFLEKAEDYSDYDYQQKLQALITTLKMKISKN